MVKGLTQARPNYCWGHHE